MIWCVMHPIMLLVVAYVVEIFVVNLKFDVGLGG